MQLTPSDMHIWHIKLNNQILTGNLFPTLPSIEENIQASHLHHPKLYQCYMKTHWAMRYILGAYLSINPDQVALRYTPLGKPELIPDHHVPDLRFNLSHSGDCALFAVTLGAEVGVDLETRNKKHRPIRLAKRYFTQAVVTKLAALPEAEQQIALLKLWTQYEAYKKAQGIGLRNSEGLLPLDMDIKADQFQTLPTTLGEDSSWHVAQLNLCANYIGAVVIKRTHQMPKIHHINHCTYNFTNPLLL